MQELHMPREEITQITNQLLMASIFLVMFVPFFVVFVQSIPQIHKTLGNVLFVIATSCILVALIAASTWYWALFSIHVRSVRLNGEVILIERFFAPSIEISACSHAKARAVAVPSFREPGYQRGTLFWLGALSFYLPSNFPEAGWVSNQIVGST